MNPNIEYTPSLILDPVAAPLTSSTEPVMMTANVSDIKLDIGRLSEEEQKMVRAFSEKIDITDINSVMSYGSGSQKNIASFSENTLNSVRTKELGEVGHMLSELVVQLKGFNIGDSEKKGFLGIKRKLQSQISIIKAEYNKAEVSVNKIAEMLKGHQTTLMKDTSMLDKMYRANQAYFKELTMYILAGKLRLEECVSVTLPAIQNKARESGLPEDAQAASDFASMIDRFEKKLYDLDLTRMISIQMAPQIRLIQNNDSLMIEKIQSSLVNTIPLWKSQMVLALGLRHSELAMEAQREVTDMTNEFIRKNAEQLKQGTIDIVKESERGIVDFETIAVTNQRLIETLDEVRTIHAEGRQRRRDAESELKRIEGELKHKLLELRD